jgi:hypothetical protein
MVDLLPLPTRYRSEDGGFPTSDDRWTLVKAFIRDRGIADHQIRAFNDFIDRKLPKIIEEMGVVETEIKGLKVAIERVEIGWPRIKGARRLRDRHIPHGGPAQKRHVQRLDVLDGDSLRRGTSRTRQRPYTPASCP